MESGDRILVAAGLTAAVVVGAFVLWGPGGAPRTRKRRGQIAGLHNLGRTCFLNTLIQALAACPSFIAWLQKYSKTGTNNSMITTLQTVLEVVNGTHESARGTPVCPLGVLNCLKALGWVVPEDQQDAHELLHVLLSCVEEESQAIAKKPGCLSDALTLSTALQASSAMVSPASPPSFQRTLRAESSPATPTIALARPASAASMSASPNASAAEPDFDYGPEAYAPAMRMLQKGVSRSFCHLEQVGRGWGTAAICLRPPQPSPFHGTLAARLQCTVCNTKTPIRYDKFDSVSLPLSQPATGLGVLSLSGLLRQFTAPEMLKGVRCERCAKNRQQGGSEGIQWDEQPARTRHIKTLSFGKLPLCLCLHIARTQWDGAGLSKRGEYVSFPEILSLAPYTSWQPPVVDVLSLLARGADREKAASEQKEREGSRPAYRLCAVVVHVGGPRSGHFVTYRRGNGFESKRWFYTSDAVVREVSLHEVLHCCAYMLFYERIAPPRPPAHRLPMA